MNTAFAFFIEPCRGVLAPSSALCAAWPERVVMLRARVNAGAGYLVDLSGVSWERLEIIATALGFEDPAARALLQELCEVEVSADHFVMIDDAARPSHVAAQPDRPDLEHVLTVMAALADRATGGDLVAGEAYEIIRAYAQ